jgi:hypothetical protein
LVFEKPFQVQFPRKKKVRTILCNIIITENQRDCILKLSLKDELEKGVLQQWEEKI